MSFPRQVTTEMQQRFQCRVNILKNREKKKQQQLFTRTVYTKIILFDKIHDKVIRCLEPAMTKTNVQIT